MLSQHKQTAPEFIFNQLRPSLSGDHNLWGIKLEKILKIYFLNHLTDTINQSKFLLLVNQLITSIPSFYDSVCYKVHIAKEKRQEKSLDFECKKKKS